MLLHEFRISRTRRCNVSNEAFRDRRRVSHNCHFELETSPFRVVSNRDVSPLIGPGLLSGDKRQDRTASNRDGRLPALTGIRAQLSVCAMEHVKLRYTQKFVDWGRGQERGVPSWFLICRDS